MKPKDSENRPKMNEAGCRFSYFRDTIKNRMEQENVLIIDIKGELIENGELLLPEREKGSPLPLKDNCK